MQKLILFFFLASLIFSCSTKRKNLPEVSNIKADVVLQRFDNDFFDTKLNAEQKLPILAKKYGKVLDYFLVKNSAAENVANGNNIASLLDNVIIGYKPLYDSTQLLYKDLNWLQKDLESGFKYLIYHYPSIKVPKIFTLVGGFDVDNPKSYFGIDYANDSVAINLQMFMGVNFSAYDPQIYYDYIRVKFNKDNIVKNIFSSIINDKIPEIAPSSTLIETMIDAGKRVYMLDQILPYTSDEIKLGYSKAQLKQCYKNEFNIWSNFVNANNLFTVEPTIIKEYIGENPFTKDLGNESPGNIGAFVGWQIVKKYMQKNASIKLQQLMQLDNKIIYNEAKYKPS
jgi:hypothetical protein